MKALAQFVDGMPVGVGLCEQRLIEGVAHLPFGLYLLMVGQMLLGGMHIDGLATLPDTPAQSYLAVGVGDEIGLDNLALHGVGDVVTRDAHDVLPLLGDSLGQT